MPRNTGGRGGDRAAGADRTPPSRVFPHGSDGGDPPNPAGSIERQVRAEVGALITGHPMGESLAEMSYNLARTLDNGAGLAVAAVNRELRANLLELAGMGVGGDDDLDIALSTPVVSPEVRDPKDS